MSERRTLRTRGEVIEEYSRDFPAEIVETYSRPLPGAIPEKAAVSAAKPRKKRRVLKGLLILLGDRGGNRSALRRHPMASLAGTVA